MCPFFGLLRQKVISFFLKYLSLPLLCEAKKNVKGSHVEDNPECRSREKR